MNILTSGITPKYPLQHISTYGSLKSSTNSAERFSTKNFILRVGKAQQCVSPWDIWRIVNGIRARPNFDSCAANATVSQQFSNHIPYLPIHTQEEHKLFVSALPLNGARSIDYHNMAFEFNLRANGSTIFFKLQLHMKTYKKKYDALWNTFKTFYFPALAIKSMDEAQHTATGTDGCWAWNSHKCRWSAATASGCTFAALCTYCTSNPTNSCCTEKTTTEKMWQLLARRLSRVGKKRPMP